MGWHLVEWATYGQRRHFYTLNHYHSLVAVPLYAHVGIPVPLGKALTYKVPPGMVVRAGARVLCTLRNRKVAGLVLAVNGQAPAIDASLIKPLVALIDKEPIVDEELLGFLLQLARYYYAPIGEVLRLALPAVEREQLLALRQQGSLLGDEQPGLTKHVGALVWWAQATAAVEAPGSLRGQAAAILALLRAGGDMPVAEVQKKYGNARAALKKLATLKLVVLEKRSKQRDPFFGEVPVLDTPPKLNADQKCAVEQLVMALRPAPDNAPTAAAAATMPATPAAPAAPPAPAFLLFGVTGSGKTEVYMHAIAEARARGLGALVLVPEIALTPQLVGRFRERLGDSVAVLHSGLADGDRHAMWKRLRNGELSVAVGARSALFAPVVNLGLVVVDEEHDGSYKQEEGVRYHARDMALLRAHRAGAVCLLGSATPSLETLQLCRRGKLKQLTLRERATAAVMPTVEVVDIKRIGPGPSKNRYLSLPLHRALERTLANREQAIIFLNRRGFAPAIVCEACGVVQQCVRCSVALTYHRRRGGRMRCHYCDFTAPLAGQCRTCHRGPLVLDGLGTEKLEGDIAASFPEARIARLDRDVAAGAKSAKIIARVRAGEVDVLVGTQMVTKGHDLPAVTLVGVVNADTAMSMPDFRAAERGFQLLVQVAGRAGRHSRKGHVIIQTRDPHQPALVYATRHDVESFVTRELEERRSARYPPFYRLALLRVQAEQEELARRGATKLAAVARTHPQVVARQVEVLGPAPAPIARLRNRYRFRVMLRAAQRPALRRVLDVLAPMCEGFGRKLRAVVDVDPVSML